MVGLGDNLRIDQHTGPIISLSQQPTPCQDSQTPFGLMTMQRVGEVQRSKLAEPKWLILDVAGVGLGILFGKLQQGVIENHQILSIARMRADAEELYGARLGEIPPVVDKMTGGFSKDDGATVRKVGRPHPILIPVVVVVKRETYQDIES